MIVCDEHEYVFIHIPHSAGMSIRYFLRDIHEIKEGVGHKHSSPRMIDEFEYNDYFKFAVIRNHWDWFKSMFAFMVKNDGGIYEFEWNFLKKNGLDFNEFIDWYLDQNPEDLYGGNRDVSKNLGGLYHWVGEEAEVLDGYMKLGSDGFSGKDRIWKKINVGDNTMPHVNKNSEGYNKTNISYNEKTKRKVYDKFKKEIDFFEFTFNE